jgi:citrate synthase
MQECHNLHRRREGNSATSRLRKYFTVPSFIVPIRSPYPPLIPFYFKILPRPVEELAEKCTFLEVSYLLIYGNLPSKQELETWTERIMRHTFIHENMTDFLKSFRFDAHPMGMMIGAVAAMSTFHPEASTALQGEQIYDDESMINKQIFRLIGKVPTLAACAYRHRIGRPYNNPSNSFSYTENFLYMLDRLSENNYVPNPRLAKALDVILILHADHELNCSTAAMRQLASTGTDPYTAVTASMVALYGPSHGGAKYL